MDGRSTRSKKRTRDSALEPETGEAAAANSCAPILDDLLSANALIEIRSMEQQGVVDYGRSLIGSGGLNPSQNSISEDLNHTEVNERLGNMRSEMEKVLEEELRKIQENSSRSMRMEDARNVVNSKIIELNIVHQKEKDARVQEQTAEQTEQMVLNKREARLKMELASDAVTSQCACPGGAVCNRVKHIDGHACNHILIITASNRHRVCKVCRSKTPVKKPKPNPSVEASREDTVNHFMDINIPSLDPLDPGAQPVKETRKYTSRPQNLLRYEQAGQMVRCNCVRGGECYRDQHKAGELCDRHFRVTKSVRHRQCKRCRSNTNKGKKKIDDVAFDDPTSGSLRGLASIANGERMNSILNSEVEVLDFKIKWLREMELRVLNGADPKSIPEWTDDIYINAVQKP